jgi:hypothetical protein
MAARCRSQYFPDQFEDTPKALANFSPAVGAQRQPWVDGNKETNNPERVRQPPNPFRVIRIINC